MKTLKNTDFHTKIFYMRRRPGPGAQADPHWPPRPPRIWIPDLLFASAISLLCLPIVCCIVINCTICAPLISLFRLLRTCPRYYRDPESCRVAIVGAGWSGLAIAARLKELGVPFKGFESADDVGGTWHDSRHYANLSLHAPGYTASFAEHEFPDGMQRPCGSTVQRYIRSFAEKHRLLGSFSFSTKVERVHYDAQTRTCTLTASTQPSASSAQPRQRDGMAAPSPTPPASPQLASGAAVAPTRVGTAQAEWGTFDLVVFASVASEPWRPALEGAFHGQCYHACEMTKARMADIAARGQRVVLVGGGKSSCEVAEGLIDSGVSPHGLVWLVRRPYVFLKYERCFHAAQDGAGGPDRPERAVDPSSTAARILRRTADRTRAWVASLAFALALCLPCVGWRLLWAIDYLHAPHEDGGGISGGEPGEGGGEPGGEPSGGRCGRWEAEPAYHMGILDARQRRLLSADPVEPCDDDGAGGAGGEAGGEAGEAGGCSGGSDGARRSGTSQSPCPRRRYTLVRGMPERFDGRSLLLSSGARIDDVDVVVWATGYRTGATSLSLTRSQGRGARPSAVAMSTAEAAAASADPATAAAAAAAIAAAATATALDPGAPLFEHMIPPRFPCLALPSHCFLAPGPESARQAAEYLTYHLCVRPPLTEAQRACPSPSTLNPQPSTLNPQPPLPNPQPFPPNHASSPPLPPLPPLLSRRLAQSRRRPRRSGARRAWARTSSSRAASGGGFCSSNSISSTPASCR